MSGGRGLSAACSCLSVDPFRRRDSDASEAMGDLQAPAARVARRASSVRRAVLGGGR